MSVLTAVILALVCAVAIFTTGVVVKASGKPIDMRKYRIGNILIPIVFFLIVLLITN